MNKQEALDFFKSCMAAGMTQEEALQAAIDKAAASQPVVKGQTIANRPEWISGLNSLSELDRAIKVAFAKRSKAKGRDSKYSYDRCTKEIEAGQERARELRKQIKESRDPIAKAIELGEDPSGIIQIYLDKKEIELEVRRLAIRDGKVWTNTTIKAEVSKMDSSTPDSIANDLNKFGEAILARYNERVERHDMRVEQVNRLVKFFDSIAKA